MWWRYNATLYIKYPPLPLPLAAPFLLPSPSPPPPPPPPPSPPPGLPTTKLSTFLEDRVNNFLRMEDTDTGEITIRVVSSGDKTLETRTNMRERFRGMFPTQFPYRTKAIFAFQKIDGAGICFFGMHVQEYGSDCPAPNTRSVGWGVTHTHLKVRNYIYTLTCIHIYLYTHQSFIQDFLVGVGKMGSYSLGGVWGGV